MPSLGAHLRHIDEELEQFLESVAQGLRAARFHKGAKYNSPHEAVLTEGIVFPHEPYTSEERALLMDIFQDSEAWAPKQCFFNAQMIAQMDPRLEYAEGYVLSKGLPIALEHAWTFLPESGKPVDITLRKWGEDPTCDPKDLVARASRNLARAYRGVVIPTDEIRKRWLRTDRAESFLQDPSLLRKILKTGLPKSWGRAIP